MISILPCTQADAAELAKMNCTLIEDEIADNSMTLSQLEERMAGFLSGGYAAYLFEADGAVAGYALVDTTRTPLYLRQFFICREARRKGYGTEAFAALLAHLNVREMDLDVFVWNTRGISFWKSLGFTERCFSMRYTQ